jgi:Na+-driven multidrug efflux pump
MASKAIGNREYTKVNMVFSSAIFQAVFIGGCIGVGCWRFSSEIASLLCKNHYLLPYLTDYLQVLPWCFGLTILVFSLVSLIEADGHPHFATKALLIGALCHVGSEVLCVGYWGMGIKGAAYAMMVNYLLVVLFIAWGMHRYGVSYRWQFPKKNIANVTLAGLKEGMPMMMNELLYSLMLFLVNAMVGAYLGELPLLHWAICVQLLMFVLVVVDCAEGAVLSIGGMLIGEKDGYGFYMLVRQLVILMVGLVLVVVLVVCCFPNCVAGLFGDGADMSAEWSSNVRIFSLMLVPHALSVFMRSFFQVLDRRCLGVLFSFLQVLLTVAGFWTLSHWGPSVVWWGFPLSAFL